MDKWMDRGREGGGGREGGRKKERWIEMDGWREREIGDKTNQARKCIKTLTFYTEIQVIFHFLLFGSIFYAKFNILFYNKNILNKVTKDKRVICKY